jgi:hypothetical protein
MKQPAQVVSLLMNNQETFGSNLARETDYPD